MAPPRSLEQHTLGNAFLISHNPYQLLMMEAAMSSTRLVWNGNVESHLIHWRGNLKAWTPAPIRKQHLAPVEGSLAGKRIGDPMADTSNVGRGQRKKTTVMQEATRSKGDVKDQGHTAEDGVLIQEDRE